MEKRAVIGLVGGVALMGFAFGCERAAPTAPSAASAVAGLSANGSESFGDKMLVRWDVGVIDGSSSATASSNARITFTGHGTFRTDDKNREDRHVTGGGTWQTSTPSVSGTYTVTALLSFQVAPGALLHALPPSVFLPDITSARAGLAFLRIRYSDGANGILVVSCRLPGGVPGTAEGISASKGFVDFWRMEDPDFTLFQIVNKHDDD